MPAAILALHAGYKPSTQETTTPKSQQSQRSNNPYKVHLLGADVDEEYCPEVASHWSTTPPSRHSSSQRSSPVLTDLPSPIESPDDSLEKEEELLLVRPEGQPFLVEVRFRCRWAFYFSSFEPNVGEYVVVEADRGFDLGYAVACHPSTAQDLSRNKERFLSIIRVATAAEVFNLRAVMRMETECLEYARGLSAEEARVDVTSMEFIACEFQYDCGKLYLYYTSTVFQEFLPLAKLLFRRYGCRVWIHHVDRANCPEPTLRRRPQPGARIVRRFGPLRTSKKWTQQQCAVPLPRSIGTIRTFNHPPRDEAA